MARIIEFPSNPPLAHLTHAGPAKVISFPSSAYDDDRYYVTDYDFLLWENGNEL